MSRSLYNKKTRPLSCGGSRRKCCNKNSGVPDGSRQQYFNKDSGVPVGSRRQCCNKNSDVPESSRRQYYNKNNMFLKVREDSVATRIVISPKARDGSITTRTVVSPDGSRRQCCNKNSDVPESSRRQYYNKNNMFLKVREDSVATRILISPKARDGSITTTTVMFPKVRVGSVAAVLQLGAVRPSVEGKPTAARVSGVGALTTARTVQPPSLIHSPLSLRVKFAIPMILSCTLSSTLVMDFSFFCKCNGNSFPQNILGPFFRFLGLLEQKGWAENRINDPKKKVVRTQGRCEDNGRLRGGYWGRFWGLRQSGKNKRSWSELLDLISLGLEKVEKDSFWAFLTPYQWQYVQYLINNNGTEVVEHVSIAHPGRRGSRPVGESRRESRQVYDRQRPGSPPTTSCLSAVESRGWLFRCSAAQQPSPFSSQFCAVHNTTPLSNQTELIKSP
ncbi:hypothetical protein J6590_023161 [Homalodisca vitripennis]|nr:hypothetical protein J6590_023161 [Homalodisca vitripennis]